MIILRVEKQNKYRNNLYKSLFILFLFIYSFANSQTEKDSTHTLKKVGLLYNSAKENNILFGDPDYDYKTDVLKLQFFYLLNKGNKWDLNLIIQPRVQIANHQLLNEQFITPDEANFLAIRERLTQKRKISLVAFELGFQFRRKIFHQVYFETTLGLGAAYIDKKTERLAQGFTFIENLSVGLAYKWYNNEFYLGTNIGHVSNFNIQEPNSGYNILGFEIGYRIYLN